MNRNICVVFYALYMSEYTCCVCFTYIYIYIYASIIFLQYVSAFFSLLAKYLCRRCLVATAATTPTAAAAAAAADYPHPTATVYIPIYMQVHIIIYA